MHRCRGTRSTSTSGGRGSTGPCTPTTTTRHALTFTPYCLAMRSCRDQFLILWFLSSQNLLVHFVARCQEKWELPLFRKQNVPDLTALADKIASQHVDLVKE